MVDQKHEHGKMDTGVQEKTFAGFMSFVSKSTFVIFVAMVLLYLINGKIDVIRCIDLDAFVPCGMQCDLRGGSRARG